MNILVTGASGFVGRALIRGLAQFPCDIYALDVQPSDDPGIAHFLLQDLTKEFVLEKKIDFVFHLAAHNVTHIGTADAEAYQSANILGTANLLKACPADHFVFLSTVKVYQAQGRPLDETSPVGPVAEYEKSKWAAEEVCRKNFHGKNLCVLRSVNIVGPGQSPKAIVPIFFANALANKPIDIFTPRETLLQFIDVEDLVLLFRAILDRGGVSGLFNVASPEAIRIDVLAEEIIRLCASRSKVTFSGTGQAPVFSKVIATRAEMELGWRATTGIHDMLRRYHDSVKGKTS